MKITFDGVERGLPESEALFLADRLRTRHSGSHPVAVALGERIEREARRGTFEDPAEDLTVDEAEKVELARVLAEIDLDSQQTGHLRSLQMALLGERWPGEPGYVSDA